MITKKTLILEVAKTTGNTQKDTSAIVSEFLSAISKALADRQAVYLDGIGTFKPVTRAARTARNPATGKPVEVPEKTGIKFKPSSAIK